MHPSKSNIGAYVKAQAGLAPLENAAGTRNGSAVDVSGYKSLVLLGFVGAASGTPTTQSVIYSLETSADGSTGWTELASSVATAITADSGSAEKDVNLADLPTGHMYVRVKEVTAFTGGTTPKIEGAAALVLGGAQRLPV